uniref:G_PROTEIN_RECEP_F1_2 domain-containing protein n=1 Tax=Panagrellus redivivus TaxID=6233 RepID=A0A7E4V824_PANRE
MPLVHTGGIGTMIYSTCFMLEFLPFCAVIGTSIMTLAIGIDRFLGFHVPFVYRRLNFTMYIGTVYFLTACYALTFMILFFLTTTNWNEKVLCIPGSVITLDYVYFYLYTTACFYVLTIIQYVSIWIMAFKKRKTSHGYMKIMKPITIIVTISLTGWLTNYIFEVVAGHVEWNSTLSTLWGGITVNLAVAFDFWVYYLFSSEYRKAFRKQLCRRDVTEVSTTTVKTF